MLQPSHELYDEMLASLGTLKERKRMQHSSRGCMPLGHAPTRARIHTHTHARIHARTHARTGLMQMLRTSALCRGRPTAYCTHSPTPESTPSANQARLWLDGTDQGFLNAFWANRTVQRLQVAFGVPEIRITVTDKAKSGTGHPVSDESTRGTSGAKAFLGRTPHRIRRRALQVAVRMPRASRSRAWGTQSILG
jgi:hypothetical protein